MRPLLRLAILLGLLASAGAARATCPVVPFVFPNGQPIDARQINTNFSTLRDCIASSAFIQNASSTTSVRALQAGIYPMVLRDFNATPSDGGTGFYYWDNSSSCTDDAFSCIKPASNPTTGRWRLGGAAFASIQAAGRILDAGTISGTQSADFTDLITARADTTTASRLTNLGKINAMGAYNTFGGAGSAGEGQRTGLFAVLTQNGPTAFTSGNYQYNTGIFSYVTVNQGNTTAGQEARYFGFGGLVEIGGTTAAADMTGLEVDANIGASATVGNRIGILASIGAGTFASPTQATDFDGAFALGRATSSDASWNYGYMLRGPNGVWPLNDAAIGYGGLGASNSAGGVAAELGSGIDLTGIAFTFQQYISDSFQIDEDGRLYIFTQLPHLKMRDTNVAVTAGGLTRWASIGGGSWAMQINTAAGGDFSTGIDAITMGSAGNLAFAAGLQFTALPTVAAGTGKNFVCIDSSTKLVYEGTGASCN